MLSTEWVHEKTKDRLMRLCLQVFTCKKIKSLKSISLEKEDNIKLVEIDVEITKIDSFLKTIRNYDHIVAQMTERAIENNQEMKVLLSGIKLLS
jgi:3D (Asp-Asp-Asp) domain-containing protein